MPKEPRIYKNYNDYWRNGKHGFSSAGRDIVQRIWEDLEPTILANRTDYEKMLVNDCIEQAEFTIKLRSHMFAYLKEFNLEKVAGIGIWRWMLDRTLQDKKVKKVKKVK